MIYGNSIEKNQFLRALVKKNSTNCLKKEQLIILQFV